MGFHYILNPLVIVVFFDHTHLLYAYLTCAVCAKQQMIMTINVTRKCVNHKSQTNHWLPEAI